MIPKDWSEVDIELFVKLYPTFKEETLTNSEKIKNKQSQLSIIKNISFEDAENCTVKEAHKVKELLTKEMPTRIVRRFSLPKYEINEHTGVSECIGKTTYRFNIDANDLNAGGYVGVMNAIKDDPIKNMHVSIFNLATPIKRTVKGWTDYEFKHSEVGDRMNEFKKLPLNIAYPISVFFLNLLENLTPVMEDYLSKSMEKMSKELDKTKEDLLNGDGQ